MPPHADGGAVPYAIAYTDDAELDLRALPKRDQQTVLRTVPGYLAHEPAVRAGARKPLDPNPHGAAWQLRLGDLRVLYAIDEPARIVWVLRIGRKVRERLFLRGVPVEMRVQ